MDTETSQPPPGRAAAPHPWRATVAGAVAGGLFTVAVGVPVTWAALRADGPAAATPAPISVTGDAPPAPSWDRHAGGGSPDDATAATEAQSQGVVLVDTTLSDGAAAGTGLVIDPAGLVLTNYHVVEGSTSITVTLDGTAYDAAVLGDDATADVALLQLDGASGLEVVDLDDDGDLAVSDTVTAIGNAEGQGSLSASTGSVIALDRSITTASSAVSAGAELTGLIETDAYVVGGYSGGALLDEEGEVVGITTAASQGGPAESYAVPIVAALAVAAQIERGEESAQVQIGPAAYLGVGVVSTGPGLLVEEVDAGSAAEDAGVRSGARITTLDGTRVDTVETLRAVLAALQPGDVATLRWRDRAGASHRASVRLAESPVA